VIWYGGDYNPEQWPEEIWEEDVRLMRRGGISLATVGVFSWAKLEPREGEFDFGWLDRVLDGLHAGGIRVDLATATASPPPWLTHRYPEVLPVTENGTRLYPGSRQQYCPSSPVYRRLAARLTTALVERYADHPALEFWHVNNEYGCHVSRCYCDVSAAAFRVWLQQKYDSIDALNTAWGTAFWSQGYADFAEIYPPRAAPSFKNPTQLLDFDRFSSDELLACYRAEAAVVRAGSPGVPITTNFMGFFKPVDYWAWAAEVDVISDDAYPDPVDPRSPSYTAMERDLMRSLKRGQPWLLMEQASSAVNWRKRNAPKRPGQMRALSYQAVARGADAVLFFQWRQSVAGAEKFHSALLPHAGTETRVWREVEQLGEELHGLSARAGTRVSARTAIVFDWDSWWSIEQSAVPAEVSYVQNVFSWYSQLWQRAVSVDFVRPTDDLSGYDLVIVPSLFAASAEALRNLDAYARDGGTLLVTYQSAITDENAHITAGGYLGQLRTTLGVWIEEFAPLAAPDLEATGMWPAPETRLASDLLGSVDAEIWAEYLHPGTAEVLATFTEGSLDGWPALTRNVVGSGAGWYLATQLAEDALSILVDRLLDDAGVDGVVGEVPAGVEIVRRGTAVFAINHSEETVFVPLAGTDLLTGLAVENVRLEPQGVAIIDDTAPDSTR
jgi:beta-galactosidase